MLKLAAQSDEVVAHPSAEYIYGIQLDVFTIFNGKFVALLNLVFYYLVDSKPSGCYQPVSGIPTI